MKKYLAIAVFFLAFSCCLITGVQCAETENVGAFGLMSRTVRLNEGDSVEGSIQANGGYGMLTVLDPDDKLVTSTNLGMSGYNGGTEHFSFFAEKTGYYEINYWNMAYQSVTATIDYSVQISAVGFLQSNAIWIIGIILIAVVGGVLLFWRSRAKGQKTIVPPIENPQILYNEPQIHLVSPSTIASEKRICKYCRTENKSDAVYCRECGDSLE